MKKIALLLAFVFLISTFPVLAASKEDAPSELTKQAKVLLDLKLITEYEENASVTQEMLYNALGTITGSVGYGDVYFTDYKLNNTLEYVECVMIMLDFLGYGKMIKSGTGTYNYSSLAKQCGLTSGVALRTGNISMKEYTKLLYNFLNTNLLEVRDVIHNRYAKSDETVMSKYFNACEYTGVLTSAGNISINSSEKVGRNVLKIGDSTYTCYLDKKEEYVGYNIRAWINNDNEVIAIYYDENKNKDLIIEAKDLHDVSQSNNKQIHYRQGKTAKKVNINPEVDVVYGGTFYPNGLNVKDLNIASGNIKLIDNDYDGWYDVVFINNYINEVVDIYAPTDMILKTKDGGSYDIQEYVEDYGDILDSKGKKIKLSNISVNNIVSIRKNKLGIPTDIIVSIQKISGILRNVDISDRVVSIDDEICALAYDRVDNYKKDAVIGDEVTAFKNAFDEVVYLLVYSAKLQYAYAFSCKIKEDEEGCIVKLVNSDCKNIKLITDTKIKYNGTKQSPEVFCDEFKPGLIKYAVNAEGKINVIETPKNAHSVEVKPKNYFSLDYDTTRYDAQPLYVVKGDLSVIGSRYAITSETLVFYIPTTGKEDSFYAQYGNNLSDTTLYSTCKIYDVNEDYEAGVITVQYTPGTSIYADYLGILVTKVVETVNDDGDSAVMIQGYQNGNEVTFVTSKTDIISSGGAGSKENIPITLLTRGSIIQVGRNYDNEVDSLHVLYLAQDDPQKGIYEWCDNSPRGWYGASQFFFNGYGLSSYGKVIRRTSRGIVFNGHTPTSGEGLFPVRSWDRFINLDADVPVLVYERGSKSARVGTMEDITTDDWIFIQISESRLKSLVVYKE